MKSYKRQIEALEQSIQKWVKLASKSKNNKYQATDLKDLLPLLKKAIHKENEIQEIAIDEQIESGFISKLSVDATISPKHNDIKELQQFLSEDNIRDTNPILILSFKKLIGLTIDYLQNLEGMLLVLGKHSHQDDRISIGIKEAIVDLFKGNDVNSYELNNHIRKTIGEQINLIFSGRGVIPLADFCLGLAHGIRNELIIPFQNTNKRTLKKTYGKKFRKHKKSPYPFISKILTAIDLHDIPFDIEGDLRKEKLYANLATWYSNFLQQLLKFEAETKVDFSNQALLKKTLTGFGNSLSIEVTPIACKTHLADNVVASLGSSTTLKASDLAKKIKQELDLLRPQIKTLIDTDTFKGAEGLNNFLGIQPENYFDLIRTTLEENHFDEYKAVIKDWVKAVDQLMNKLGVDRENGKYNYQSKVVMLNLSKLFNIEHNLLDFNSFIAPILESIKATGYSLELTEIDRLFSEAIAKGAIYNTLIDLYNTSIEAGTFSDSFDTLETTLPSMDQISYAILDAKIDLILNRETQFLKLSWTLEWRPRNSMIDQLVEFALNQIQIPELIRNFGDFLSNEDAIANDLSEYIEWFEINLGTLPLLGEISFSIPVVNFARMLIDAIRATIGDNIEAFLDSIADITERAIANARALLQDFFADMGGDLNPSTITLEIPIKLGLGLSNTGKPFAFGFIDPAINASSIYSIVDTSPYEFNCEDIYSSIESSTDHSKDKKINSLAKITFEFINPGISLSTDISAMFISTGGSIMIAEKEVTSMLSLHLTSAFVGNSVEVTVNNISTFTNIQMELIDGEGELSSLPTYNVGVEKLTFKAFK